MKKSLKRVLKGMQIGVGILIPLLLVLGGVLLADALHVFQGGNVVSASQLNANFNKLPPVGAIIAWHKNLSGAPALPDGWVECNGQLISDSESPFNGQTTPNLNNPVNAWNSRGVFLRGHTSSGVFENDAFQAHKHNDNGHTHSTNAITITGGGPSLAQGGLSLPTATNGTGFADLTDPVASSGGTPRFGQETVAVNMSVVWVMRIK